MTPKSRDASFPACIGNKLVPLSFKGAEAPAKTQVKQASLKQGIEHDFEASAIDSSMIRPEYRNCHYIWDSLYNNF